MKAKKSVSNVYDEKFGNLHLTHKFQSGENLDLCVVVFLYDPPYDVCRQPDV